MNSIPQTKITLEDIARRKEDVLQEIHVQKEAMTKCAQQIVAPLAPAVTAGNRISRAFNTGMAIYEGVTLGIKLMRKFRFLFRR